MTFLTFHFSGFAKGEKKLPDEDAYAFGEKAIAVFDGVPVWFTDPYPVPSPGFEVATMACKTIIDYLENESGGINSVKKAFQKTNKLVRQYNFARGATEKTVNHMDIQYGAAVGAFGYFDETHFHFGQLNDCGVMGFDSQKNRELDIIRNDYAVGQYFKSRGGNDISSREEHVLFRSSIVNNKNAKVNNEPIEFGVMTGEPSVNYFLRTGSYPIPRGGLILIYSDGFIPFVFDSTFTDLLFSKNEEKIRKFVKEKELEDEKFRKEKTLIMFKN